MATLPTVYGEKVVVRILDKTSVLLKLDDLGFLPQAFERYESAFTRALRRDPGDGSDGFGEVHDAVRDAEHREQAGPATSSPSRTRSSTGSRASTRCRSTRAPGLTFASALRSILRADPDVVLVGEIRDHETAQIAIEAALTGHLVLSSMHTNDAPSALPRLIEMGVEPYLVASAIDCVVAQRLVRKLCMKCREAFRPDPAELAATGYTEDKFGEIEQLFRPVGCAACSKTGFRGRVGLYEVMPINEEMERLTVERASSVAIAALGSRGRDDQPPGGRPGEGPRRRHFLRRGATGGGMTCR